ncbi:hypothetical protein D7Y13_16735 [Corallococcus praedator]|uniref:Uncharacterized protein n=1 Tax=Corallococcus praedator TaxID=2316724 RepID=A0ABX9QJG5_9BACT|nr:MULTISPECIES: hypothetical protein [Corallococcus]RKH36358.1 hypothetical protein D7X75_00875 [Corallococcus sp. CA031C]RKI08029.1 hypothetical protein D7Y13_16735 [Corallococcus praedator]
MQLRKMMVMLAAVSTMSFALTACGDDATTPESCSSDTDCASGFCNTAASVCMDTCESAADCPDTEKECAALAGATNTAKVCQCKTNQLCNEDDSTSLVCGAVSKRCEEPGTNTGCTKNSDCGTGETCDTATGQCVGGTTTCSGEGRATCAYGSACYSGTCQAPTAPTCENYTNFGNKSALGTTGPIIFKVATTSAATDSFCPASAPKRVKITISAYSSTPFPATSAELNGLFYVLVNGTAQAPSISSSQGNYVVTGTNRDRADIVANLCVAASSNTASLGYYFTGGNFFCFQSTY